MRSELGLLVRFHEGRSWRRAPGAGRRVWGRLHSSGEGRPGRVISISHARGWVLNRVTFRTLRTQYTERRSGRPQKTGHRRYFPTVVTTPTTSTGEARGPNLTSVECHSASSLTKRAFPTALQ